MVEISALVTATWNIIAPFLSIVASKGSEEIGKRSVGDIWELVKARFSEKPETKKVAEKLLKEPQNPANQEAFRHHLKGLLEQDPGFSSHLTKLIKSVDSNFTGQINGDGVLAQGDGAKAVGKSGVFIGGSANSNTIITGSNNNVNSK